MSASFPEFVALGAIFAGAGYLFWSGRLRGDLVAISVMIALILPWPRGDGAWRGILSYREGFAGFGSPAVLMVGAMFVLGAAMIRTGVAELLGGTLFRACARNELLLQAATLAVGTALSMLMNDTAVVLVLMPVLLLVCREKKLAPGRYLMGLGYGSLLGGQWTLVGTRSNVVIGDYLLQRTGEGMGFFDLTPMAAVIFIACAVAYLLVGRRFLPEAVQGTDGEAPPASEFVVEAVVTEESAGVGRTLEDWIWGARPDASVLAVIRNGMSEPAHRKLVLRAGDVLLFGGPATNLRELLKSADLKLRTESAISTKALRGQDMITIEAMIGPDSAYIGSSFTESRLGVDFGFSVMGLSRHGRALVERPADVPLRSGDVLLLLGSLNGLPRLENNPGVVMLERQDFRALGRKKAAIVLSLLLGIVVTAAGGWLSPAISIPLAALLAILSRCLRSSEIYHAVDWPSLVTVAGMIPFGLAIEKTGAAQAVAEALAAAALPLGPLAALAAMLLLSVVVTQLIENAAAAIILCPVAYHVAEQTGASPKPFLLGTALCVSAAFCTPVAHESTILIMGPGGYRFGHYLKVGGMLALLTWLLATLVTPLFWPLRQP